MQMKKKWAKKWVEALRSGKYKQTQYHLKDADGYCCLGVLCTLTEYKNNYTKMIYVYGDGNFSKNSVLPDSIRELTGIQTKDGAIPYKNSDEFTKSLASFNDSGKSFKWIANYIEKNWKKL